MSSNLKPLHRTITLDYGILISGSLTLILENNERTVLRPGDIVVQRGTLHAWENEGTEWARMYFVLLRESLGILFSFGTDKSSVLPCSAAEKVKRPDEEPR